MSTFKKSILAGICISIACCSNLYISDKILSSFLFSIALLLICVRKYYLYTGFISYVSNFHDFIKALHILFGNMIGVFMAGFVMYLADFNISCIAYDKVKLKYTEELRVIPLAILCNILIYFAVDTFKKSYSSVVKSFILVLCIMIFLLCGFEHCIANMFYLAVSGQIFTITGLGFLLLNIAGNSIGGLFIHNLHS